MAESDKTGLEAGAAWIDGEVMPIAAARLPINDWGLIHSDITYDVIPAWDGGFFRLDDYIGRFQNSAAALRLDIGMDKPGYYRRFDRDGGSLWASQRLCGDGCITRCAADPRNARPARMW